MVVSQTAEYALRAVICLAQNDGKPQTTQHIAQRTAVPQSYLPKVLQPLARCGIVSAQRGSHGGYKLIHQPSELTVLKVISCVDPLKRIEKCPLGVQQHGDALCGLHRLLDSAVAATQERFSCVTIQNLLNDPRGIRPLCSVGETSQIEDDSKNEFDSNTTEPKVISNTTAR